MSFNLISFMNALTNATPVSAQSPLPVALYAGGGATSPAFVTEAGTLATDRSGTITLGGTAQNAIAANTSRVEWTIVNNSDTLMMVRIAGTASATAGIPANPGDVIVGKETNAVSVFCATTGKAFTAWER